MALTEFANLKYSVQRWCIVGSTGPYYEGRHNVYCGTSTDPYNVGLADGAIMTIATKFFSVASMDIYAYKNMGSSIEATYVAWNLRYFAGDGDKIACWSTTAWAHHSGTTGGSMATIGAHWKLYWDESPQGAIYERNNWHTYINPVIYYDWVSIYPISAGIDRVRIWDMDRTGATVDLFPGTRICVANEVDGTITSTVTLTGVNAYYKLFNPGWCSVMASIVDGGTTIQEIFGFWAMDMPGFTSIGTGTSVVATLYIEM